jgi:hypothetical protein
MQMTSLITTPPKKKKSRNKTCISPKQNKQRRVSPHPLDSTSATRNFEEDHLAMEVAKRKTSAVQKIIAARRNKVEQEKEQELEEEELPMNAEGSYEEYVESSHGLKMTAVGSYEEYILSLQQMKWAAGM